jgi:hypothetical protein
MQRCRPFQGLASQTVKGLLGSRVRVQTIPIPTEGQHWFLAAVTRFGLATAIFNLATPEVLTSACPQTEGTFSTLALYVSGLAKGP